MLVTRSLASAVVLTGLMAMPGHAATRVLWTRGDDAVTTGAIAPSTGQTGAVAPAMTVDTSALLYYLRENNPDRVEAEIRRLQALYPGWRPPADLSSLVTPETAEAQQLWTLLGQDKLDDLKAEIGRRQARDPMWQPPQDLLARLQLRDYRHQLVAASDAKDWQSVKTIAGQAPALIDVADLDVLWRVAEADGRTGDTARALDLYRLILSSEMRAPERLATVQKAAIVLGPNSIGDLLALGRKRPDGTSEFASVVLDITRGRMGKVLSDANAARPAESEIAALEAAAQASRSVDDALLIGWYRFKQDRFQDALTWFHLGRDAGPSAKTALGEILALDRLGRHEDARALAESWRDKDDAILDLFVDLVSAEIGAPATVDEPVITPERMANFVAAARKLQSGTAAQVLGWYAFNNKQYAASAAWFDKAMQWKPDAKTAEGHLLAVGRMGDRKQLADLEQRYAASFPEAVHAAVPPRTATTAGGEAAPRGLNEAFAAYKAGRADNCLTELGKIGPEAKWPAAARRLAGWCDLLAERPHEAAIAFQSALSVDARDGDAAYGLALARLRNGETSEAVVAARDLVVDKRTEIGVTALAQQALASFNAGRYAETLRILDARRAYTVPSPDLEVLRGWAMLKSGRYDDGYKLFRSLDDTLSTRDTRAGLREGERLALGRKG